MTEPLIVPTDDLRHHSHHLDTMADDVGATRQAAGSVTPGPHAYGRLCVIVPAVLAQTQSPLVDAIGIASRSARDTAADLRAAADRYEAADEEAATSLRLRSG